MLWICKNIWALWKYTSHSTRPQTSTENLVYFEKETDQISAANICHLKWRRFQKMRGEVIILVNFPFSQLLKSSAHSVLSFPNDILHCTNLIFAFLTASPEWWSSSVGDIIATLSLFSILSKPGIWLQKYFTHCHQSRHASLHAMGENIWSQTFMWYIKLSWNDSHLT